MNHSTDPTGLRLGVQRVMGLFGVLAFLSSCSKPAEPDGSRTAPAPSAQALQAATTAPNPPLAGPKRYAGKVEVARIEPRLTDKQGAPSAWAKDDGSRLTGPVAIEVTIAASGEANGTLTGALGTLTLTGALDGQTLRAVLVNTDRSRELIQNGVLLATEKDNQVSGTLTAATGDGLLRRGGTVTLTRSPTAP